MNHVLICICLCPSPFYILLDCLAFLSRSKDSSSESWQPLKDSLIWELWDLGVLFTALPQILLLFSWRFLKVWFGLDFAVVFIFFFFYIQRIFKEEPCVAEHTSRPCSRWWLGQSPWSITRCSNVQKCAWACSILIWRIVVSNNWPSCG